MKLDKENFANIIDATPLVSIDLIVRNKRDEVLLGRRNNRPAQGYWFVPGGRIRKNEKTQDALRRIAQSELGTAVGSGKLLGVFDHFYNDNYFGIEGISTHYVVFGYQCEIDGNDHVEPDEQHTDMKWWRVDDLLASDEVHDNTKLYFREADGNGFWCRCGER